MELEKYIRNIPDFPKEGIQFKDITTLLKDGEAFRHSINLMTEKYKDQNITKIVGIESRGFIFGSVMAWILGCGFIPARKPGKLPAAAIKEEYELEYGTNTLEMHEDAISEGDKVVIADDLLATGGTAEAVVKLIERLGGQVAGLEFLVELEFLNGREKLGNLNVNSYLKY